ncbi:CubicO group peptidase (beta-lactamase class C family) [Chitinophaga niastensis]|uniref:CubicO group peptidase (Beta-lactamase class C family) n=1 Tax=Chitinophaga niastensis TaxID=536980 RepID=A0A2P8HJG8_CHINA|nr:serine hydrolase [Chitinophaga niastensis]PSL46363.1 CubicO group peptidase (beta-lactamase class C family) [Chitinophaga niastensis]
MKIASLLSLFISLSVQMLCLTVSAQQHVPLKMDLTDKYIRVQMQRQHIPGLSLCVIKDGKIVQMKGYGLSNIETNTPATPATVYKIASVSKQFIAAAIMLLHQDGKLNPDAKLSRYIDSTPQTWNNITIRNLLSHTSGLIRDVPGFDPLKVQSNIDNIKSTFQAPLEFEPGTNWRYSNINYYVLAEIVEKVSGMPWAEFIQQRIFKPAGMSQTRLLSVTDIIPNRANGYEREGTASENAEIWLAVRPSGAFMSDVIDLAKWDTALYTDSILTADSKKQMWTPAILNNGNAAPYGYGWFTDVINGHRRIHHGGGLPGFSAAIERYPDDRLTVIVLANTASANPVKMARHIAGYHMPALKPMTEKPIVDTEPHITIKVKALINGSIKSSIDTNLLSDHLIKNVNKEDINSFFRDLTVAEKINDIILIDRSVNGDKRRYSYRLDYEDDNTTLIVVFDKFDKLSGYGTDD